MEESKEKNNPITNLNNTDIDSYQNIISSLFENNIKFQFLWKLNIIKK